MTPDAERIVKQALELVAQRRLPESTYRLQFHAGFTFRNATALVAYLADLGITDCYASPYLKARPGSQHGYDITDHSRLNPEIGSDDDFEAWCTALAKHGLGQILDVVPNHMAVVGNENVWWNDILENGPSSPYSHYFDIAWSSSPRAELQGRVLIPVLGEPYGTALESQQLRLQFEGGAFSIHYFEHRFPIAPRSYELILTHQLAELEARLEPTSPAILEYHSIITAVRHLPSWHSTDPVSIAEGQREKEVIKRRLAVLTAESEVVAEWVAQSVAALNGLPGKPESFDLLEKLLDEQPYRLAYWRVAVDEINYRRFFDVNELAALNLEHEDVFLATHQVILRLLEEDKLTGLRIDHPDGLYDPRQYLDRLQQHFVLAVARRIAVREGLNWDEIREPAWAVIAASDLSTPRRPLYVIVEKILEGDEPLRANWPADGTTGYDFLKLVNGLFVAAEHARVITRFYHEWTGDYTHFSDLAYWKKALILQNALSSELQMLTHQIDRLAQKKRWSRDFTQHSLRQVLRAIIASFPVYRTYVGAGEIVEQDAKHVIRAVSRAMARNPDFSTSVFNFVRDTLLVRSPGLSPADAEYQAEQRHFAGKFQQVTAPVMAKGVEDTAFYVYNRLLSLNEVGSDPGQFGYTPAAVHRAFQQRQAQFPWTMSATSTHDTKRSEDVRARLNVLSELPEEWQNCVSRWSEWNRPHFVIVDDMQVPDRNEEILLYQTLVGAWPIEPCGEQEYMEFVERIQSYMQKALQEAKVHTSWINPNASYHEAVRRFIAAILDLKLSERFLSDLRGFQKRVSHLGMFGSLAQVLLKIAAPGVPDFYQGAELWDFSLVDPDNRRPVDFERRTRVLAELKSTVERPGGNLQEFAASLVSAKDDGRIKMFTIWRGLQCRRRYPGLFTAGEYEPVEAYGAQRDHVFSFIRRSNSAVALVVVPRLLAGLIGDEPPLGERIWGETALLLPEYASGMGWRDVFTGQLLEATRRLALADTFRSFPVALLLSDKAG